MPLIKFKIGPKTPHKLPISHPFIWLKYLLNHRQTLAYTHHNLFAYFDFQVPPPNPNLPTNAWLDDLHPVPSPRMWNTLHIHRTLQR